MSLCVYAYPMFSHAFVCIRVFIQMHLFVIGAQSSLSWSKSTASLLVITWLPNQSGVVWTWILDRQTDRHRQDTYQLTVSSVICSPRRLSTFKLLRETSDLFCGRCSRNADPPWRDAGWSNSACTWTMP